MSSRNSDAVRKSYLESGLNDLSIIKSTENIDFNDKKSEKKGFVKINYAPAVDSHLTPKIYVDKAIHHCLDESTILLLDPDEKLKLDEQDPLFPNSTLTSAKTMIEIRTKSFVDSL